MEQLLTEKQTAKLLAITPFEKLRIGADNLSDLMRHLEKWESDFDVRQIKLIGMMRLVSGTPYWG